MPIRCYDALKVFDVAARHLSFTAAAAELNLTKGAISHQVARLEHELGFKVFTRHHRRIALTDKGTRLWRAARSAFAGLDREITGLKAAEPQGITVGMSTYFASRWLSPRLMTFITAHPDIALRLQPLIDLNDLTAQGLDMAIRWGNGDWRDAEIEPLLSCPAFPTAAPAIASKAAAQGIAAILPGLTLLHDRDASQAWHDWHEAAGLPYTGTADNLVIPDPNVRVQAVKDGQGIALNDNLVADEIAAGRLSRVSEVELADYGYYLAYAAGALEVPALREFRDWIVGEAGAEQTSRVTDDRLRP